MDHGKYMSCLIQVWNCSMNCLNEEILGGISWYLNSGTQETPTRPENEGS